MKKVMLMGERNFLVDMSQKVFHTEFGMIDLTKIKKYGQTIKTNKGVKFVAVEPTIIDLLSKCKRMPQIVTTKDTSQIAASTGVSSGWKCLDAGAGSGFMSIFIGNLVKPKGSVVSYEKDSRFAKNVEKNVKLCNLDKIVKVKNIDASKFTEKDLDLITLDMIGVEKIIKKAYRALKPGGWLAVYSPHIEQQKKVLDEIRKMNFTFVKTVENIQRVWQVSEYTHPVPSQLVHTGFLTVARKVM